MHCLLCGNSSLFFYNKDLRDFYFCKSCFGISVDKKNFLSISEEENYYQTHKEAHPKGYNLWIEHLYQEITTHFPTTANGLDYGSGISSSLNNKLISKNYKITEYDPIFHSDTKLKGPYDFIICNNVIENFHHPYIEFNSLKNHLKKGGLLYLTAELFDEKSNFDLWEYKNDFSRVFFYHHKTLEWIKEELKFNSLNQLSSFLCFKK